MLRVEARTALGAFELDAAVEVPAGSCLALAGPSGAGKSTLLRVAAGLLAPRHGRVTCGDDVWLDTAAGRQVAPELRACGYVFQDYALFGHMAVWQNVAYGLRGVARAERRRRAGELLERFGIERLADERPRTLSGGERQRVALARALAAQPRVLLLDEPLSALDARTRASASRELAGVLRDTGVPALLVTHDFTEAAVLGDRVAVIDAGRIVQEGTAGELAAAPHSAFVADFTGAVVLTGVARPQRRPGDVTIVDLDGGGAATSTDRGSGPVALSVHPWEIALEPAGARGEGSAQNHLDAEVVTVTHVGNRVRVGLAAPQPLVAEITGAAVGGLHLAPGVRVTATWKATATRLVSL
ncbi:MAG: Molybdenum transport ATP-binding protein ModC [uncultured Solirubrobacteraceae bacterium]|uniref:Molybdenum transport ATP-binding protein ModC n=1 Tax=uncultured Solirubrobacteraceae bacterium TaxID=1162706 RepID=A0A6J4RQ49_9ACTN|nr:MAG: Molybdenum transport ATP-binding protein ModC [uncultured Solirubrobacteraceae bacterium]